MPKDYKSFVLVAAHLVHNAHRYYGESNDTKSELLQLKLDMKTEDKTELKEDICKSVYKKLRELRTLKKTEPYQRATSTSNSSEE